MEGIEKITAKIAQDAQAEVSRLEGETQAQVDEILTQAKAQAEKETADTLAALILEPIVQGAPYLSLMPIRR